MLREEFESYLSPQNPTLMVFLGIVFKCFVCFLKSAVGLKVGSLSPLRFNIFRMF